MDLDPEPVTVGNDDDGERGASVEDRVGHQFADEHGGGVGEMIEVGAVQHGLDEPAGVPGAAARCLLLAPLAPHLGEELWALLGHPPSVGRQPFPVADPALLVDDTVTLVVQVNGKVRDRFEVATTITAEEAEAVALASVKVVELLAGSTPKKVVTRPPTLVNVVV